MLRCIWCTPLIAPRQWLMRSGQGRLARRTGSLINSSNAADARASTWNLSWSGMALPLSSTRMVALPDSTQLMTLEHLFNLRSSTPSLSNSEAASASFVGARTLTANREPVETFVASKTAPKLPPPTYASRRQPATTCPSRAVSQGLADTRRSVGVPLAQLFDRLWVRLQDSHNVHGDLTLSEPDYISGDAVIRREPFRDNRGEASLAAFQAG